MSTTQNTPNVNDSAEQNMPAKERSWFKIFGLSFISLIIFILLLLLSPWGTRLALSIADSSLDELSIDYASGGIFSDLHIRSLNWQQTGTQAKIKEFKLDLAFGCLISGELCIDNISAQSIAAKVTPSETPVESDAEPIGRVIMPLPIYVKNIKFGKLSVEVKDQLDLSWQSLVGKLDFYQVLQLERLSIDGLNVETHSAKKAQQVNNQASTHDDKNRQPFDFSSIQYNPITSLPIELPLHFVVKQFELPNFTLQLAGQAAYQFETIALQVSGDQQQIDLQQLLVKHNKGQLEANAKIGLAGNLQHQFNLHAEGEIQTDELAKISITSGGNLDKLNSDIRLSGPFEFTTKLEAQLSDAKLPLLLHTHWQSVKWPLTDPTLESAVGDISLQGNLANLQLAISTQATGQDIPDVNLQLSGSADLFNSQKQVDIKQLLVNTLGGSVTSQGQLLLTDSLDWQGKTQLDSINIEQYLANVPAQLNGDLNLSANNHQGVWQAAVSKLDINGAWMDYPLTAKGKMDYHQTNGVSVEQFLLANGANKMAFSGTLDQQNKLAFDFNLDAPKISQSVPDVKGAVSVNGQILGSVEQPQLTYNLNASQLAVSDVQINQIGGDGSLVWDDTKPLALDLSVADIVVAGNQVDKANLQITGDAKDHQVSLVTKGDKLDVELLIAGKLSASAWHGQWLKGTVNTRYSNLTLEQPFDIQADWGKQNYNVSSHCWQENQGQLCINQANFAQQQANWDISLANLDWANILQKLELEGPKIQTKSALSFDSKGQWSQEKGPLASLELSLSPSDWTITQEQSVTLNLQNFALKAQVTESELTADVDLVGTEIGQVGVQFKGDSAMLKQDLTQAIDGKLFLSGVNLASFKALVPELETLQGIVKGDTKIAGTLSKPLIYGELGLENAEVKGESLPVSLSEVNQKIVLNGQQAEFDGSYKFGKGVGEMTGQVSWLPDLVGNIVFKGDDLEVNHQDMVKARISPNIKLSFAPEGIDLKGELVVPYARVKIRELPPGSISPSDDVIFVEQEQAESSARQKLEMNILVKVDPEKSDEVKLDAYGLTSDLRGELRVENNLKGMFAHGELSLANGRYRGNGQNLVIREGDISFSGTLDRPYLNIEAIRDPLLTEDGVIAGLRVQGEAERPKVKIFSEPEMEQQQSLSYMLTGRGIGESSDDSQDTVITNALVSIGLGQSENLVSKVGNKLGFEDVAFDTSGQGDETQLSLTGTIAPGLQLRYGVGVFDSVSEVAIRYELLPKLYLEAVSSLTNAVDLYYQFSIEGSQNRKIFESEKNAEQPNKN
ncbi:autotransporter assembly complex protein TamB [Paraglaciecola sp.]|uniref:autotransporter assembly complex protein TamB n=1 Tax=Paraglaciecola sp. TaxID=1920173 RepID=UPI003EF7D20F